MREKLVYEYLCKNHLGKANLIKNKDLRKIFNVNSDKTMRKIIQNIREDKQYEKLVGSVSGVSGGFYICTTREEVEETINNTKHRANQMFRTTKIMEWKSKIGGMNL